jgi:tetratricopeptide (TPR) repeat protein
MYHDIEKEPLPFFLREVSQGKRSGHLFITAKDFQITLHFMNGTLANGMSTRFDEKLPVILHLMGRINEEQYNFISGLHQFSDDQVAGILIDQNLAKKKDVYYARLYQLRRIAISSFSLQKGKWIFTAGEPDPPLRETFEIPLEGILVEGARSVDHISAYASRWQHDVPVLFNEMPIASEIYFTEPERTFYAAVQKQGWRTCQELISRLNVLPLYFWRVMLAFYLQGIVEFQKSPAAQDLSSEIAALLEMNRRLSEASTVGPETLGLPVGTSAAALEKAVSELLARFAPGRFGSAAAPEIKNIARAVCARLETMRPPPLPAEPVTEITPPIEAAPVIETEWIVELKTEDGAQDHPAAKDAELLLSPEFEVQSGPGAADEAVVDALEQPGAESATTALPERPFDPVAAPPSMRLANAEHEKAWNLLLRGKELYEKHDYSGAITLLKQAVKMEPGQADFYHLLGMCQSRLELMHNEAEANLKKAIELKSWSADPVYALGVLYRGQGKMKLAERCFQRVKEISYEHTGASRALVDLRRLRAPAAKKKK